jgi:hypothetical protein
MAFGPAVGLDAVDALRDDPTPREYHWLPSVRGNLLARLGRNAEARMEFERAAALARNEREFLLGRAAAMTGGPDRSPRLRRIPRLLDRLFQLLHLRPHRLDDHAVLRQVHRHLRPRVRGLDGLGDAAHAVAAAHVVHFKRDHDDLPQMPATGPASILWTPIPQSASWPLRSSSTFPA